MAFAPAHVTGFFAPDLRACDPRGRGSIGAGLVLELGVTAFAVLEPGRTTRVTVEGDVSGPLPISLEAARGLVPPGSGRVRVHLTHQMPVGQGFGMSAAGALSTALAVAGLFGIPRQRAVEVAHLAELFGGGGLGGVAAILGGGLEYRIRAGVPPAGRVVHRSFPSRILIGVVGRPLASPRVLADPHVLRRITGAANDILPTKPELTSTQFLEKSERFTDRVRLTSPALTRTLRAIRTEGGWAAQAMFGRSFFAVPRSRAGHRRILRELERRRIPAVEMSAGSRGAMLLPGLG
ncbi:MAG: hypothetical protein L3K02_07560 [Thermoplasmata archaeon]|nr:hypothetical protein [Thermoplasmata archaeon]